MAFCFGSWLKKKSLNGCGLDRRALSLGEAELDKVIKAVFQCERNILRGIILKKEEETLLTFLFISSFLRIVQKVQVERTFDVACFGKKS